MKTNNNGYEYEIDTSDAQGNFVEIYRTNKQGKRGKMHLSIFVNDYEGETVEQAIEATRLELYDPIEVSKSNLSVLEIARQRCAFEWFAEAYASVQEFKNSI